MQASAIDGAIKRKAHGQRVLWAWKGITLIISNKDIRIRIFLLESENH